MLRDIGLMIFLIGGVSLLISRILARSLGSDIRLFAILGDGIMICGASLALIAMTTGCFVAAINPQ